MAFRRGPHFDPNVDAELLASIEAAARGYQSPYDVELTSGFRGGDPRFHGKHKAIDFALYDPKTGAMLPRYQAGGGAATPYQQFANYWYSQLAPEQQQKARWGGYFGDPTAKGYGTNYGEQDFMHLDFGGDTAGMLGGGWTTGFRPEAMKALGLSSAGGVAALDQQMQAAGYTPEQRRNAIASIESAGSGDYNAVGPEADPAGHRARGRYQVMDYNIGPWAEQYLKRSGVTPEQYMKDPGLQDQLFDAVYGDYVSKYGERGAASKWFTGSENEPGTTDANGKLTGKTYADRYMEALGATPHATHPPNPTVGRSPYALTAEKKADPKAKFGAALADAVQAFGGGAKAYQPPLEQMPEAARVDAPVTPIFDTRQADANRQQLSEILARLNGQGRVA